MDKRLRVACSLWILLAGCGGGSLDGEAPQPPFVSKDFVYVANNLNNTGSVSGFELGANGSLTAVPGSPFAAGANPNDVKAHPSGKFVYVGNSVGTAAVSGYSISERTGALTPLSGSPFFNAFGVRSLAVHPSGKFLYATTGGANLAAYSIDSTTGALTSLAAPSSLSTSGIACIALHPGGKSAYVANGSFGGSNDISTYAIDATSGVLTATGTAIPAGTNPQCPVVHPGGKFLYLPTGGASVLLFAIDPSTGLLNGAQTLSASAAAITIEPNGQFLYMAGGNAVTAYSVDTTTGALTAIGTSVAAGNAPRWMTIDPSGKLLLVVNAGSGDVSRFAIDGTTGRLTTLGAATPAGSTPFGITAVHRTNP